MEFTATKTARGFALIEFRDHYGAECSLQESSLASEAAIWLGCSSAEPRIMASQAPRFGVPTNETTGWVPYPVPREVLMNTRMHLTREEVAAMLPYLVRFAETGEL